MLRRKEVIETDTLERISSTEFRRVYAKLKHPVVVTIMGRPIGVWRPITVEVQWDAVTAGSPRTAAAADQVVVSTRRV
jgi:hypothetical protein